MILKESEFAVGISRYFLVPLGIWPLPNDASIFLKILCYLAVVWNYFLILFLLTPCALHTVLEEDLELDIRLKLIGPMSFCVMGFFKYAALIKYTGRYAKCFQHIEEDWKKCRHSDQKNEFDEEKVMTKNANFGRSLSTGCTIFMFGGGLFYYAIMPLLSTPVAAIANDHSENLLTNENLSEEHQVIGRIRGLSYPVYRKMLDVSRSPVYEFVYIGQVLSGYVLCTITMAACCSIAIFVMHVCGQLEVVMALCRTLIGESSDGEPDIHSFQIKVGDLIERHLRALKFASTVEESIIGICFVEFLGCTLNICLLGYYFLMEWERNETFNAITYIIILCSFVFNIFILCYIGEVLTEQCKQVGDISYSVPWYRLPGNLPRDIIMIIHISKRPAKITAGKLVDLNFITFASVMKTACTYLHLLRTFTVSN